MVLSLLLLLQLPLQLRWFHGVDLCSCQQLPRRSLLVVLGLVESGDLRAELPYSYRELDSRCTLSLNDLDSQAKLLLFFLIIIFGKHLGEDLSSGFHPALLGLAGTGHALAKWETREMELVKPQQPAIA